MGREKNVYAICAVGQRNSRELTRLYQHGSSLRADSSPEELSPHAGYMEGISKISIKPQDTRRNLTRLHYSEERYKIFVI